MGSRVRDKPKRLFEFFAEVAKPDNDTEAFILQSYPPNFNEEDVINNVTKFAFPCETDGSAVDHFTFVLTDLESMYRFGFCRHATGAQTCLCVISFLPWFEVFYNFLNHLAEVLNRSEKNVIEPLLRSAYVQEVPGAGIPVTVVAQQEMFSFTTPDPGKLPSIPSSRNLTEYYNAVDCNNMMKIFAGMLNERRILITSKKLSRLTACVHGSEALLYPMHWQHLFIPVLPAHLIDYCSAPMPYLIGVHSSIMQKIRRSELGDAIIVDADNNTVESEHDDLEDIPGEVVSHLKKALRSQQSDRIKTTVPLTGDAISKAFLHALVKLIGGYREALLFRTGEPITFEPEAFVRTRPIHMQPFLEKMLHLQIFQQFINERLDMLNTGQGFSDIFEAEATMQGDKLNAQSRYKDWLSSMKKQGKKLQRGSKDAWSDLKKKAGPMMDSAVKSLSSTGHKAYKGIKSRIGNLNKDEGTGVRSYSSVKEVPTTRPIGRQTRPSTIVGPVLTATRPQRPPPPRSTSSGSDIGRPSQPDKLIRSGQTTRNYRLLSEKSVDDSDPRLEYSRISINLLEDPDIQNAMRKSASMELVIPGHGTSMDSLSSADRSSNTDPDRSSELDIAGVSLIEEEEGSHQPRTVVNQTYMTPPSGQDSPWVSPSPPIPAPRTKRRQMSAGKGTKPMPTLPVVEKTPPPVAEKPLIHLSPEKPAPASTNFDPLCDPNHESSPDSWEDARTLEQSPIVSPPTRQASLSRSPAFRTNSGSSLRQVAAANMRNLQDDGTHASSDLNFFDPLGSSSVQPLSNSVENGSSRGVINNNEDLMGSWNLADIAGTPKHTPSTPPPKTFNNSQVSNQRAMSNIGPGSVLGRSSIVSGVTGGGGVPAGGIVTAGGTGVGLNNSSLYNTPAGNRSPVYFPSGQPNVSPRLTGILQPQTSESSETRDPFASLVDLSPAKQAASPPPRASWEKFDQ
ncbi:DENN domain-containing protein 1B-like [Liolophura sinensis]|uniref:DENN domain-containing protein 1B-like n=1 Tax=Liolophura sinensis TaxID=3198878 RepID=UPI0031585204